MDLDNIVESFVNSQTLILCLAIYLMTYVIRKVVEGFWKDAKQNRIWREVWLPIGPIANGAILGVVMKTFVWPAVVHGSLSGRIAYGAICGAFSALIYARVRSWVQSGPMKGVKVGVKGVKVETPSIPPMTSDPPGPVAEEEPKAEEAKDEPKVGGVGNED